ncbi:hypothetical protein AMTRI_Chr03g50580 [Amborella trichopoda]
MPTKRKTKDIQVHNSSNYVKRRNGLQKKLHELSVRCGIDACIISFSDASSSCVPDISPQDTNNCLSLCERYLCLDKSKREKKLQNCSQFLSEKIQSLKQQIEKKREENMEAKLEAMVYGLSGHHRIDELSIDDLQKLSGHIDVLLHKIRERDQFVENGGKFAAISPEIVSDFAATFSATPEVGNGIKFTSKHEASLGQFIDTFLGTPCLDTFPADLGVSPATFPAISGDFQADLGYLLARYGLYRAPRASQHVVEGRWGLQLPAQQMGCLLPDSFDTEGDLKPYQQVTQLPCNLPHQQYWDPEFQ